MNWFVQILQKEARNRRFNPEDRVRYFTGLRKGKGKGLVMTPPMSYGRVKHWDDVNRRYRIVDDAGLETDVHPRNLIPDSFSRPSNPGPVQAPSPTPNVNPII